MSDAKKKKKWIKQAVPTSHKGALHKHLGVPQGQKIPAEKLQAALHSSDETIRKEANLAKTFKGMKHKGKVMSKKMYGKK